MAKSDEYTQANAESFMNVLMRTRAYRPKSSEESMEFFNAVARGHVETFKQLWGPQKFTWDGEFRYWVWVHELKTCKLFALTSSIQGTSYELVKKVDDDNEVAAELLAFLKREVQDKVPTMAQLIEIEASQNASPRAGRKPAPGSR